MSKPIQINDDNRIWLKDNFMFHGKNLYKWSKGKPEAEFLNDVWRLVADCMSYAYSKGYRAGHLKGFARGLEWQRQ